jgi:hypothetical protein
MRKSREGEVRRHECRRVKLTVEGEDEDDHEDAVFFSLHLCSRSAVLPTTC